MLIVTDSGEREMLAKILNGNLKLKLYTFRDNNITNNSDAVPQESDIVSFYTEPTDTSYAKINLALASWSVLTTNGITQATYPEQTFTFAAGVTVLGYFVTNEAENIILWAEEFNGLTGFTIPSDGGTLKITPKISLD
jgi:hypothetical protein